MSYQFSCSMVIKLRVMLNLGTLLQGCMHDPVNRCQVRNGICSTARAVLPVCLHKGSVMDDINKWLCCRKFLLLRAQSCLQVNLWFAEPIRCHSFYGYTLHSSSTLDVYFQICANHRTYFTYRVTVLRFCCFNEFP